MISRDWRCGSTRESFQGLEVWLNEGELPGTGGVAQRGTASRDILEVWLNEGELPGTGGVAQRGRASRDWRCGSTRESFQGLEVWLNEGELPGTGSVAQRARQLRHKEGLDQNASGEQVRAEGCRVKCSASLTKSYLMIYFVSSTQAVGLCSWDQFQSLWAKPHNDISTLTPPS